MSEMQVELTLLHVTVPISYLVPAILALMVPFFFLERAFLFPVLK